MKTKSFMNSSDSHHLAVIVPFRKAFDELQAFLPHMDKYLRNKNIDHTIYIINQADNLRFNRASLINAAWHEIRKEGKADYLVMHDVDLLPLNKDLPYGYPRKDDVVVHVASPQYHPRYHYKKFIGGILLMKLKTYELVDGMSNRFWGWGQEDDELFVRLREKNIQILRPNNLTTTDQNTFLHLHDKIKRPRDGLKIGEQKIETRRRDRITGLHDVSYEVEERRILNIDKAQATVINVKLHCDIKGTPWCMIPTKGPSKGKAPRA
ncbi:unnamed protein product [Dimorphilus gyrociliatus]|uniref:Uncharacterized protein n=1 Tax=Dimorphilus gyrociliatus TaxID=2664684 RepID=A0A7I8VRC9_9ANNE|nr:unnamed protein product [Dimorphilus gyrociliatus]